MSERRLAQMGPALTGPRDGWHAHRLRGDAQDDHGVDEVHHVAVDEGREGDHRAEDKGAGDDAHQAEEGTATEPATTCAAKSFLLLASRLKSVGSM